MNYQSGAGAGRSEWLLNTVKQNPEGLLLLAAGAVLLLRKSVSSASPRSMSHAYSQPNSQYPHPAGASVGDTMREFCVGIRRPGQGDRQLVCLVGF